MKNNVHIIDLDIQLSHLFRASFNILQFLLYLSCFSINLIDFRDCLPFITDDATDAATDSAADGADIDLEAEVQQAVSFSLAGDEESVDQSAMTPAEETADVIISHVEEPPAVHDNVDTQVSGNTTP